LLDDHEFLLGLLRNLQNILLLYRFYRGEINWLTYRKPSLSKEKALPCQLLRYSKDLRMSKNASLFG
jgi:hypothetical protein